MAAAFEPGTFEPLSDVSTANFEVAGQPFIELFPTSSPLGLGDTLSIDISVEMPNYDFAADYYMAVLDPEGYFWSPRRLGGIWQDGLVPILSNVTLAPELAITLYDVWTIKLPSAPFDKAGTYIFLAAPTMNDSICNCSDIAVNELRLTND
jgi:hypothetical protein